MKSLLVYLILISSFSYSQEIECMYPPSNDYTGTCEAFYQSGKLRSQTDFVKSLRHGNHVEYYESGQLAATAKFHQQSYIGEAIRYSEAGVVTFKMDLDSSETGSFFLYAEDGKQLLEAGGFKNGYRDGEWKFYDENGNLIETKQHDSDATRAEIQRTRTPRNIVVPAEETIDELFFERLGLPFELLPETIVDEPDVAAEFPEGISKMKLYIMENVNYPISSRKKKEQGRVYVTFIVELDGSFTDVKIMRGEFPALNEEAIRLVESMPNWNPAIYRGQKVRSKVYLPITFTLN